MQRRTAKFDEHSKDFPNCSDQSVILLWVLHSPHDEVVEAKWVNEKRSIDPVDQLIWNAAFHQSYAVDFISVHRDFILCAEDYPGDVQVLGFT